MLSEIKYELDWMMKMQREDGALYHKATCRSFCGFVMPEEETDELVLSPVSVTATADFAAVTAMAVRFYEKQDRAYGEKLTAASKKAYEALKHMELPGGFLNPEGIVTGEYADPCDEDERYWAAAELYKAFGDGQYRQEFEEMAKKRYTMVMAGPKWEAMATRHI